MDARDHGLDDMVWHAPTGPQSRLAESTPDAVAHRYRDGIAPDVSREVTELTASDSPDILRWDGP